MAHDKLYGICRNKCFVEVVPKTGGTFTGGLTVETYKYYPFTSKHLGMDWATPPTSGSVESIIVMRDKNNVEAGRICANISSAGNRTSELSVNNPENSDRIRLIIHSDKLSDGTFEHYVTCPTPASASDNTTKIATTAWVNRASTVVHTTGSEDISGFKKFLSGIALKNDGTKATTFMKADGTEVGYLSMSASGDMWIKSSTGKITFESPNGTVNAPATPSNATGTEIATAGWVNSKIESAKTGRIEKVKLTVGEFANATGYQINGAQVGDIVHYHIQDILGHSFIGSFEIGDLISTQEVKYSVIGDDVFRIKLYSTNLGFWFQYFMNDYMSETEFRGICALREV